MLLLAALLDVERVAVALRNGLVHCEPNFVLPQSVQSIRRHVLERRAQFATASSFSSDGQMDMGLRNAFTCRPDLGNDAFATLYDKLDDARVELSAALGEQFAPGMEATFVIYPVGGFYQRHIDSIEGVDPSGSGQRAVSYIVYLSECDQEWAPNDGGALRAYHSDAPAAEGSWSDVLPHSGSLVLFDSKRVWHEVRPTLRERICLVGWIRAA